MQTVKKFYLRIKESSETASLSPIPVFWVFSPYEQTVESDVDVLLAFTEPT